MLENLPDNVIDLFTRERRKLSPEHKAHLIQRITDLSIEKTLIETEINRLQERLES